MRRFVEAVVSFGISVLRSGPVLLIAICALVWSSTGCKGRVNRAKIGEYHGDLSKVTEIVDAASAGDLAKVKALLRADPELVNAKGDVEITGATNYGPRDWTPLHAAVYGGQKDVAELLLDEGADVNARTGMRMTPLHFAAQRGDKDIARLLLANGADINAKALRPEGGTPLHFAVATGNKDVVELLLADGADPNAPSAGGTPLRVAIEQAHRGDIADILRAHGAKE